MTFEQYNETLDQVVQTIQGSGMANLMAQAASSALHNIRKRIIERGEMAEGGKFPPYSTRPMLSGCKNMNIAACSKIVGSKEKRKQLEWVTINGRRLFVIPGGYKQFRELNDRQTGWVDFSFSGDMWRDIVVLSDITEHTQGIARIGARTEPNQEKLAGNTKRKGEILKLSDKELKQICEDYEIGLTQEFEKKGL